MSSTPAPATGAIVTGVDFVGIPTRDLDAAVEFYGDHARAAPLRVPARSATTRSSSPAT